MFEKLFTIATILLVADIGSFYLLAKLNNGLKIEEMSNNYLDNKVSLEHTEKILKKSLNRIKTASYINALTTSLNMCFIAMIPALTSYAFAASPSTLLSLSILAILVFLLVPGFFLSKHEEFASRLNETYTGFMSISKSYEPEK